MTKKFIIFLAAIVLSGCGSSRLTKADFLALAPEAQAVQICTKTDQLINYAVSVYSETLADIPLEKGDKIWKVCLEGEGCLGYVSKTQPLWPTGRTVSVN